MAKIINQWTRTIDKPDKFNGKFAILSRSATAEATTRLNGDALKLWLYFMFQQSGIKWAISPRAIENEFGVPVKSYYRARDELIDKGYMDESRIYMFPKMSSTQNKDTDIPKTRIINTQNEYSNNTNNNNNNIYNDFVITSDDKVDDQPKEKETIDGFVF